MIHQIPRRTAGVIAVGATLLVGMGLAQAASTKGPTWVTTKGNTVNLTLIASWNNAVGGFNFNGGANGKLVVTVPQGAVVKMTFSNAQTIPHSVQIINVMKPLPTNAVADAFKGAHTPHPLQGIAKGPKQSFSFVANKVGTYMIICAVPGHDSAGMWDTLVISSKAKSATATLSK